MPCLLKNKLKNSLKQEARFHFLKRNAKILWHPGSFSVTSLFKTLILYSVSSRKRFKDFTILVSEEQGHTKTHQNLVKTHLPFRQNFTAKLKREKAHTPHTPVTCFLCNLVTYSTPRVPRGQYEDSGLRKAKGPTSANWYPECLGSSGTQLFEENKL